MSALALLQNEKVIRSETSRFLFHVTTNSRDRALVRWKQVYKNFFHVSSDIIFVQIPNPHLIKIPKGVRFCLLHGVWHGDKLWEGKRVKDATRSSEYINDKGFFHKSILDEWIPCMQLDDENDEVTADSYILTQHSEDKMVDHAAAFHQGYLTKQGGSRGSMYPEKKSTFGRKTWKRRWFVLDSSLKTLCYYKSEKAYKNRREPLGTLSLTNLKFSERHTRPTIKEFYFELQTNERTMLVRSDTSQHRREWRDRIEMVRENIQKIDPVTRPKTFTVVQEKQPPKPKKKDKYMEYLDPNFENQLEVDFENQKLEQNVVTKRLFGDADAKEVEYVHEETDEHQNYEYGGDYEDGYNDGYDEGYDEGPPKMSYDSEDGSGGEEELTSHAREMLVPAPYDFVQKGRKSTCI